MLVLALVTPLLASCCKPGGINYTLEGATQKLETKSAYYYTSTMTYSAPSTPTKVGLSVTAVLGDYDLDPSSGLRTLGKPLDKDGQTRIKLNLIGAEGTEGKKSTEPATAGEYSTAASSQFMKVRSASIERFRGGKAQEISLDDLKGTVKVTRSEGDSFSAEVNLTSAKGAIQGTFDARSWKVESKK